MSAHAKLSPSGAHRWLRCAGSVRLEEQQPDSSSVHAEEGTFAHEVGGVVLIDFRDSILPNANPGDPALSKISAVIGAHALLIQQQWQALGKQAPDAWVDECNRHLPAYVDYVLSVYAKHPGAVLLVEQRLSFHEALPGQFGTADAIILAGGRGELIDLKFGRGVAVDSTDNDQLKLYAVAAQLEQGMIWDTEDWRLTIVQPRILDEPSSWDTTTESLIEWMYGVVVPAAGLALSEDGPLVPGEKQCRWCKAAGLCTARAGQQLVLAGSDFSDIDEPLAGPPDPSLMSVETLLSVMERLPDFQSWAEQVERAAFNLAQQGNLPGYKIVEGRTHRKWSSERPGADREFAITKIAAWVRGMGIDPYEPVTLRSITDIEKAAKASGMPNKQRDAIIAEMTFKPPGKPTLARLSDSRPALNTSGAIDDFSDVAAINED